MKHMESHDITARIIYPTPCHKHPVYSSHEQAGASFTITENLSKELVSIPVHHGLTEKEVLRIIEALQCYT